MKRFLEHRGVLTLLLADPAGSSDGATADHQSNHMRRLATYIKDGNVAHFPAYELKELFSALAEECYGHRNLSGTSDDTQRDVLIDLPPLKKARRSLNNNVHSILRFVERMIGQRYDKRPKCQNEDDQFLGDELKSYFGTKEILFQAEEEILCLAFGMALDVIIQSDDDTEIDHQNSNETQSSDGPPGRTHGRILCDGVVKTALRIIDYSILVDKRERATRNQLQQTTANSQLSSKVNVADRRKKYEHLLKPNKKRHDNGGIRGTNADTSFEAKSIMEEKYAKQWEWLHQFRTKYESKSESTIELQESHYLNPPPEKINEGSAMDENTSNSVHPLVDGKEKGPESNFVIIRRRIETLDDVSLSSDESDEEMDGKSDAKKDVDLPSEKYHSDKSDIGDAPVNTTSSQPESKLASTASTALPSPLSKALSPYDKLDKETYELRITLLDMPPSESSSTEVVRHTVDEIGNLLCRYGELDGAAGISRCGDVFGGNRAIDSNNAKKEPSSVDNRFPLNDAMVSSLVKAFLTDATGSLRANAFLRSFVLPLMIEMNPVARSVAMGSNVENQKVAKNQGKPASRSLTSLLATLARDRPTECVVSVVVPSLSLKKYIPSVSSASEASFEPTRFQCELISRVLRGKDALSIPAITLLVEQVRPTNDETTAIDAPTRGGMKWTEHTMPVLTACLNRQPTLRDDVVAKLADEIAYHLSPTSPPSMLKSMKFSTLFHALVTKYGSQVKSTGRVESLKGSASRLKTFMSKTIGLSLKKLS